MADRDHSEGVSHHRNNVTADDSYVAAGTTKLSATRAALEDVRGGSNKLFWCKGAKNVEITVFMPADAKTCSIAVVGWRKSVAGAGSPMGFSLLEMDLVAGTSAETTNNPLTGVADSDDFYWADTATLTTPAAVGDGKHTNHQLYDMDGSNGEGRIVIDPLGAEKIFVFVLDAGGGGTEAARVDIGLFPMG